MIVTTLSLDSGTKSSMGFLYGAGGLSALGGQAEWWASGLHAFSPSDTLLFANGKQEDNQ